MTDARAGDLTPIEDHLRLEEPQTDALLLIRGGPLTAEKFVEHARRQSRDFSLRGSPMASVSVDATVTGWTVERVLRERLWSRRHYAVASVGDLRHAGFDLMATHRAPHFDIVLAAATLTEAGRLLAVFGPVQDNPYKRRGRR